MPIRSQQRCIAAVAAALAAASIAYLYPGVASYDSIYVYAQLRSGIVTDWHPPVLARMWQGFEMLGATDSGPLFVLQTLLLWFGLGFLAAAVARAPKPVSAWWIVAIGLFPPVLSWTCVVWKDAQMAAAALAGAGLWAYARERRPVVRRLALVAGLALFAFATLLRQNAVFAVVPLILAWPASRPARVGGALLCTVLAISAPRLNRTAFDAVPLHAERSQMIFDMAGMTRMGGVVVPPGIDAAAWSRAVRGGCYSPSAWDGFSQLAACRPIWAAARREGLGAVWLGGIVRHPLAYAAHRAAHLNATLRFIVPAGQPRSTGQSRSTPNPWRIGADPPAVRTLQKVQRALAATPIGWPFAWLGVAITLLAATAAGTAWTTRAARALLVSAVATEASFAVVSVASDLRYHLWTVLATGVAIAMLAGDPVDGRRLRTGLIATAVLCGVAIAARFTLTPDWPRFL